MLPGEKRARRLKPAALTTRRNPTEPWTLAHWCFLGQPLVEEILWALAALSRREDIHKPDKGK